MLFLIVTDFIISNFLTTENQIPGQGEAKWDGEGGFFFGNFNEKDGKSSYVIRAPAFNTVCSLESYGELFKQITTSCT